MNTGEYKYDLVYHIPGMIGTRKDRFTYDNKIR